MESHNVKSNKHNIFKYIFLKIASLVKLVFDSRHRSEYISLKKFGHSQHQQSTRTKLNRYPRLFEICSQYLEKNDCPKILSLGCSTGEEVFTIGEYLPNAKVVGADINEWCISQCKKKYGNPNFTFLHALSDELKGICDFDAIFCLAVLQDTERNKKFSIETREYTFKAFEETIIDLDKKLAPGGLLIIDNTDYSFMDTETSRGYTPLDVENNQSPRKRPLFDKDNNKVAEEQNLYRVFVKNGSSVG